ncbi:MAG: NAD(P)/FAD-dependent oxidoreductase [Chloroflexi bacterium AL-W]|nr:NAD(P)/FAD-dependent oxidoreductase [Chloroflexi bacterium AL-N1]NOK71329.1 NAD(P)/FAD-dependent oxidoreductase [Chloroflexi bacterium AL-N10]NOK78675.1 NAD(P)/FAD-dependent oxidoreductase [Chloroflexi bacterium AL-N5]NOK85971.1 NAD(P)/FAD-dependent oxidoreductase [Chloroflexi bacterium AL-W]NOK93054.1 NAD(P)/FAD-dependent oxidoreductase [Chloroflexi bacterium AL-N15]
MQDAIIIGGSNAGLNAALVLDRARRQVLVLDREQPRNAPSPAAHGFLSRDGTPPNEIRRIGREQLRSYESVTFQIGDVATAQPSDTGFEVRLQDGTVYTSRKLLLASGVRDELPAVDGLAERWGKSVFHCPYCHGWEARDQPLAVYWIDPLSVELAIILGGWSDDIILCTNTNELDDTSRDRLNRYNVRIREERIIRLEGTGVTLQRIIFDRGDPLERHGLFVRPPQQHQSDIAQQLGCEMEEMVPGITTIKTGMMGHTSASGVFAAGDASTPMQQAVMAAATGAAAAMGLNHELLQEDFA